MNEIEFLKGEIRDLRLEVIQMFYTLKTLESENKVLKKEIAWTKDRLLSEIEPWLIEVQETAEGTTGASSIKRSELLEILNIKES